MIKYDLDDLKRLQELELQILKEIMRICDAHDLKYYAYGGTAMELFGIMVLYHGIMILILQCLEMTMISY